MRDAPGGRWPGPSAVRMETEASSRLPLSPGHQKRLEPVHRGRDLVALDRAGRIDSLRTDDGALADERAGPDAVVLRDQVAALARSLVARVEVVALRDRDRRRADERGLERVD